MFSRDSRFVVCLLCSVLTASLFLSGCACGGKQAQTQVPPEPPHGMIPPTRTERDAPEAAAAIAGLTALGYAAQVFERYDDRPEVRQPSDDNFRQASKDLDSGLAR